MNRVEAWWLAGSDTERQERHGLVLCVALFLVHFALYSTWFVEDAAITFAFARHAALGEGFVAYPGGEPVEGFSNPSWTLLLTFLRLLGVSPWVAAKLLGAGLGAATLPLAWAWARRLLPDDVRLGALLAPLLLAVTPQFVQWAASGLENPLFCFALALGVLLLLREYEAPSARPWSALVLFALAITRPEAPLYAATAAGLMLVFRTSRDGVRATWPWAWRWGVWFLGPFVAFHALRIGYFAWEWPNTYYAKLAEGNRFRPLQWDQTGWRYLRKWALVYGMGFYLPLYVLGQTGLREWRRWAGLLLAATLVLLLLPGVAWLKVIPGWPHLDAEWLVRLRVGGLVLISLLAAGVGLERDGDAARVLGWCLGLVAAFFAVYSGGDWMDGFRWLNMGIVPLAVLHADIATRLLALVHRRWAWRLAAVVLVGAPLGVSVVRTFERITAPETSPYDVRRRVVYMSGAVERLHLDHATLMEVDMGAHLWWSRFDLIDMAGLVDVPMAHHQWEKPFVHEYVFEERQPELAHVHGHWASKTRMKSHREWSGYLEIPPYPLGPRNQHAGNHVRRDLFIDKAWAGPERMVDFEGGPRLRGWDVPVPEAAPGGTLYVEVGWSRRVEAAPFRAILFLSGPSLVSWELPPAYDWEPLSGWAIAEVVHGRHSVPLPADLPEGVYELGLLVVGESGGVLHADLPASDPVMARGEVRWADAVRVVSAGANAERAEAELEAAIAAAEERDCAGAEASWATARRRLGAASELGAARLAGPIARCYAEWAEAVGGEEGVPAMRKALRWDHRDPVVRRVAHDLADTLQTEGDAAHYPGNAYAKWHLALQVDPRRTWLRRRAEAARDARLGLELDLSGADEP